MSGINEKHPQNPAGPSGAQASPSRVFFENDAETGRKHWFCAAEQQVFGPFGTFAEADEELAERRAASRSAPTRAGLRRPGLSL